MKSSITESQIVDAIRAGDESQLRDALAIAREKRMYKKVRVQEAIAQRAEENFEARRAKEEIDLMCGVESHLLTQISSISTAFSSPSEELYYTLWLFEHLQRTLYRLQTDAPVHIDVETHFRDGSNYKSIYDFETSREYFISYFSLVLRSILKRIDNGFIPDELDPAKINAAVNHFPLASDWHIFHERKTFWERGCARVETAGAVKIVDSSNDPVVRAFRISLSRLRAFRTARRVDRLAPMPIKENTKLLPIEEFRSPLEKISAYLIALQFYSNDLSETLHGLQLREWLRTYTVLKEIGVRHAQHEISGTDWRFMLFAARADYYVEQLVNAGIVKAKAEIAIAHLTFNGQSKDMLDTPLIPVGKLLFLAPVVTALIEPAFSLESVVTSIDRDRNHDLSMIGPGLERNIIASLSQGGIRGHRLYVKKDREEFECDVAFLLDDVLFLCECKGKYEVTDIHGFINLESYLQTSAVSQQQRISMFYQKNLEHVREKFGLAPNWVPARVIDIVITSAKLGRPLEVNGVFITDENIFFAYFSRKKISVRNAEGEDLVQRSDDRLEGAVQVDSFIDYMRDPASIEMHRNFLEERDIEMQQAGERVVFKDIESFGEGWMISSDESIDDAGRSAESNSVSMQ